MVDFEFAKEKVLMGVERKSMVMSDREKRNTSYHESGHTIVAAVLPAADPLHKVTIIPRGRALGLTQQLPTEDKYRSEEHTSELQSHSDLVCRLLLEKKKRTIVQYKHTA